MRLLMYLLTFPHAENHQPNFSKAQVFEAQARRLCWSALGAMQFNDLDREPGHRWRARPASRHCRRP
jgi:hypothetical protein